MKQTALQRNESMELAKMLAAILVVFNHYSFPDPRLQNVLDSLCGFAVPMFLAISGYFNFGAKPHQIKRRLIHILKLYALAYAVQLLYNVSITVLHGGSALAALKNALPDGEGLFLWLTLQKDPFLGHLWYMASISLCYLVLWGYTQAFEGKVLNYGPLYILGGILFSGYLILAIVLPIAGLDVPYLAYRNGWFTGIPMFLLGLFLRQYGNDLASAFRLNRWNLGAMTLFGAAFCLAQRLLTDGSGLSLGLSIGVIGLVWLLIQTPNLPRKGYLDSHLGGITTGTYLFHLTVGILFDQVLPEANAMLRPLIILGLSILVGIGWDFLTRKK